MITGDAFRASMRESLLRMFTALPGKSARPVNASRVSPEHPVAPYPSNATERPPMMYGVSDNPGLDHAGPPGIVITTTALLPPVGTRIDNPPPLGTDVGLQSGLPPMRIPRLSPNREMAGVRFAAAPNSMGTPNGDLYFVPLPAIPKTTAISSRVRAGYPQLADDKAIPAVYVGGDA